MKWLAACLFWSIVPCPGWAAEAVAVPEPPGGGIAFFERKIRPVLVERCYSCHSSEAEKIEGSLRLDSRETTRKGGTNGPVIVPGDPAKSRLIQAIRRGNPKLRMPPKGNLPPGTVAEFEAWVRMGAPDPRSDENGATPPRKAQANHWAFQSLSQAALPAVRDRAWAKEPADQFVLARLEAENLRPAAPADRASLLRRLTFDLTGLAPTVAELDTFLADASPDAFTKVVDRLLASPRFGERWGKHWLDLAGYADFSGSGANTVSENAWRYRDCVINAFNRDKPYDLFVREQLAGDLLPDDNDAITQERLVATGFLLVGLRLNFEPKRAKLVLDIADDQIELTTRAFLGLTVSCARCHDHKSDPITTVEYYGLAGIFASTACLADESRRGAPRWLEQSLASPEQQREVQEWEERFAELKEQVRDARERQAAFPGDVDSTQLSGVVVDNLAAEIQGAWKESNYSTNFVDKNYLHDGDADKGKKSARFVPSLPKAGLYEVQVSYTARANRATNVPVAVTSKDGVKTVPVNQTVAPTIDRVFASIGKFKFDAGTNGSVLISNTGTKGFVVVDAVRFVPVEATGTAAKTGPAPMSAESALQDYRKLEQEFLNFRAKRPVLPQAMAVRDGKIQDVQVQAKGAARQPANNLPRALLPILSMPESTAYAITDESSGRLELANWIADPLNPLAARVAVNRIWSHLFGRGLVQTPDDFGGAGAPPSHPELLDFLARHFVEQGWSMKKLIRSLVLSSTYQMSSAIVPEALAKDPQNKLLWRMNPRSLSPEILRDTALVLGGHLDETAGGPWMPTNSTSFSPMQSARMVQSSSRRRSVYLPVLRDSVPEVLRIFEAHTNAPAATDLDWTQHRFILEQMQAWAEAILRAPVADDAQRIVLGYRQALGRTPSPQEVSQAAQLIEKTERATSKPTAWETFCQALMASPEFRTVN